MVIEFIRVINTDKAEISVSRNEEGELVIHRERKIFVISDLGERIIGHTHTTKFIEALTKEQCLKISMAGDAAHTFDESKFRSALIKVAQGIPL